MSDQHLADQLRALADAAARRRQAEPETPERAAALGEMQRIQRELKDGRASTTGHENDGGAVSTPPPWRTSEY